MSDSVKPEQQPDVKPLPVSAQRQAPSLLSTTRQFKFNGIVIGVLATIASVAFVYVKSATTKPAAQPAQPHLTAAPRKPVPELKAPLPDLFRPAEPPAAQVAAASVLDPLQVLQQQQEMQRAEKSRQLLEARLKSALDPGESQQGELIPKLPQAGQAAQAVLKPAASPNLGLPLQQDPNAGFERAVVGQGVPLAKAFGLSDPEYKILQGKVIEAITLPRIVSDLSGTVCALTQRDVYAERGRRILIPWGSRMCGVYNAELKKGQNRLFTVWNTLRVANPDGTLSEVALDSPGADQLGSAGTGGLVDSHFAEIFGTSALLSIIGAGAANMAISPGEQNYSAAQYRVSVQQAAAQTAQSVLAPYVNIAPTVTVPAGTRIRIFVNRDLDFSDLFRQQIDAAKGRADAHSFE